MFLRIALLSICFIAVPVQAEILIDSKPLLPSSGLYDISQDLGQTVGHNLFHSFDRFNLNQGEIAQFSGSDSIQNIISRVIGGEPSLINGTLRSMIPNADFYFLNPYGILFGASARLEVQGSFHASTADYLKLSDGGEFHTRFPEQDILSIASVANFGFLTDNPAPISITTVGELNQELAKLYYDENAELIYSKAPYKLLANQQFSLIGGDIEISGHYDNNSVLPLMYFPQGHINLIGIASQGEVAIQAEQVQLTGFSQFANISLNNVLAENHGGWLFIQGNQLTINDTNIISTVLSHDHASHATIRAQADIALNQTKINLSTESQGHAGNISIETQADFNLYNSEVDAFTTEHALGDAGDITIQSQNINLDNSSISSNTYGKGNAGHVTINNQNQMSLSRSSNISSNTLGQGLAGNVSLFNQGNLSLFDGAAITSRTESIGDAGSVVINNEGDMTLDQNTSIKSDTQGIGNAGHIVITANNILLQNDSGIFSSSEGSPDNINQQGSNAGNVSIDVRDTLRIQNNNNAPNQRGRASNISSYVEAEFRANQATYTGIGGQVEIKARKLLLSNGGQISVSSLAVKGGKTLRGGNINIVAEEIELSGVNLYGETEYGFGSGIYARSLGIENSAGDAGRISIQAQRMLISGGAVVESSSDNYANAGDIDINVTESLDIHGNANDIALFEPQRAQLEYLETYSPQNYNQSTSGIYSQSSSQNQQAGRGGLIDINATQLQLSDNASISTSSAGGQDAGHISLRLKQLLLDNQAEIISESQLNNEFTGQGSPSQIDNMAEAGFIFNDTSSQERFIYTGDEWIPLGKTYRVNDLAERNHLQVQTGDLVTVHNVGNGQHDGFLYNNGQWIQRVRGGNAGNIAIDTETLQLANQTEISTSTISGGGGEVSLNIAQMAYFNNSQISTSVQEGVGNGGGLSLIEPQFLVMNKAQLVAQAYQGQGGNISIIAEQFLKTPNSLVSASSQLGIDGNVQIDSPDETVSSGLLVLGKSFTKRIQIYDACKTSLAGQLPTEFQLPLSFKVDLYQRPNDFIGDWQSSDAYTREICY
ncbi:filamentous hemagglutinin N-terminal domain-containing protein [Candidatus Albibeggiatoa sp. nov. BB20]|uniref:two-partner secretion domain-containing protein n=1 Tax=Candidatus Albibeggiatoa sp. nov. BB20 TaxID=3162723 RepID=UPI003365A969